MNQNLKDLNFLKKNFEQLKAIYHRQQGEQATIQEQEASLQESVKKSMSKWIVWNRCVFC